MHKIYRFGTKMNLPPLRSDEYRRTRVTVATEKVDAVGVEADDHRPLIGITLGDPAGIGPEVVAKAVADYEVRRAARVVAFGPVAAIEPLAKLAGLTIECLSRPAGGSFTPTALPVVDVPGDMALVRTGTVSAEAGRAALGALKTAVAGAVSGEIDAIATAPWNKEAIREAGSSITGHTELLAELTQVPPGSVTMMLAHEPLRVFHVSTHIPLREVVRAVTTVRVERVIRLAHAALHDLGISVPRLAVAGLNPHSGEAGLFGDEERVSVTPAIEAAKADGINVSGPWPGDTVFWQAVRGDFDGVVAMYHDQGHIPVKLVGRGHGVNVTLGLPIVRTSVDHGTAFDIAGRGVAEPTSMVEAIRFAAKLVAARDNKGPQAEAKIKGIA